MNANEMKRAILDAELLILESRLNAVKAFPLNADLNVEARVIDLQITSLRSVMDEVPMVCSHTWATVGPFNGPHRSICLSCGQIPLDASAEVEAYNKGFCAYCDGSRLSDNPFKTPLGQIRTATDMKWEQGWRAAAGVGAPMSMSEANAQEVVKANIELTEKELADVPMVPIGAWEACYQSELAKFNGRVAAYEGLQISDNPWAKANALHKDWESGWHKGVCNLTNGLSPMYAKGYWAFATGLKRTQASTISDPKGCLEWIRGWDTAQREKPKDPSK